MVRLFVGVTDRDWFDLLAAQDHLDEVNFWQPGGNRLFRVLAPGELFLFKLHSPDKFIVGGGLFAHSTLLPASLAWDAFGIGNGASDRRCAASGERTLPVLQAAHLKPYADGGPHDVDNGLLLRSDLHTLFDRGYLTITPDAHIEVSGRIREEFDNGRDSYALHGRLLRAPAAPYPAPSAALLAWHNENVFLR